MLCDICGTNEAVLFIEQSNEHDKRKLNLCYQCAVENGVNPNSSTIGKSLQVLFDMILGKKNPAPVEESKLCPVCGISLAEIKLFKKTGCPECYSIFSEEITTIFKNIGVVSKYNGTMPKRLRNFRSVLNDRIVLQTKLEESLRNEDYEKAAVYRDYLRALEKSPVTGAGDD